MSKSSGSLMAYARLFVMYIMVLAGMICGASLIGCAIFYALEATPTSIAMLDIAYSTLTVGVAVLLIQLIGIIGLCLESPCSLNLYAIISVPVWLGSLAVTLYTAFTFPAKTRQAMVIMAWNKKSPQWQELYERLMTCCGIERGDGRPCEIRGLPPCLPILMKKRQTFLIAVVIILSSVLVAQMIASVCSVSVRHWFQEKQAANEAEISELRESLRAVKKELSIRKANSKLSMV